MSTQLQDREVPALVNKALPATAEDSKRLEQLITSRGISKQQFQVLRDVIHPNAESDASVLMAFDYCKARNLDPFKKTVHIVPCYSKKKGKLVDTVWPAIAETRITAHRTGLFAGQDKAVFGPTITKTWGDVTVTFPEWCQITVYRIVDGQARAFPGPEVVWLEEYTTVSNKSDIPNDKWSSRPKGQLEKCAEAAALRRAFPEECSELTAEEMAGKAIDDGAPLTVMETVQEVAQVKAEDRAANAGQDIVDAEVKPTTAETLEAVAEVAQAAGKPEVAKAAEELKEAVKGLSDEAPSQLYGHGKRHGYDPLQVMATVFHFYPHLNKANWKRDMTQEEFEDIWKHLATVPPPAPPEGK